MTRATEISAAVEKAWEKFILATDNHAADKTPRKNVYASGYSPCARRLLYDMDFHFTRKPFSADAIARMRRGSDRERDLLTDLARIGRMSDPPFEIMGQQERFTITDHKDRTLISGKVDSRLQYSRKEIYPLEVKCFAAHMVERIDCFEDLFSSPWTTKAAMQLLCYMQAANVPFGFLLFDRAGLPAMIPAEMDSANMERLFDFLANCEKALDARENKTEPDYITSDRSECQRCDYFGGLCNPPSFSGEGAQIVTDPDILQALEEREKALEAHKKYEKADKLIKETLRGIELALAGNFLLEGKWQNMTRLELPADKAAQLEAWKAEFSRKNPKGKFILKIIPMGG